MRKRLIVNVDLKTPELRNALDEMVAADKERLGEMTPSLFVRKLIRQEYALRKFHPVQDPMGAFIPPPEFIDQGRNVIHEVREDSPIKE